MRRKAWRVQLRARPTLDGEARLRHAVDLVLAATAEATQRREDHKHRRHLAGASEQVQEAIP